MAKISTLVLKVDLQCEVCSKKIRKVLCKLQDRENIQSMVYNEKEGVVIVSGPFDPKKLSKKLCCKACKVIKGIQINPPPSPPPPPPPPPPKYPCSWPYPYPYLYPYPMVWPFIPVCGCHGWCDCKSATESPPVPPVVPTCFPPCYHGCKTCKFICVDEPSFCSII